MKRYLRLSVLALMLLCFAKTPLSAQNETILKPLDSLDDFLAAKMKKLGIPGLQVAVVSHGRIIKSATYGLANVELGVPVTSQTVFSIASATKSFTGIAIMQLVEDGLIDLSAPVSRYLDSLPAAWQPVTIKQLLTHVSGIPNIIDTKTSLTIVEGAGAAWAKVQTLPMDFAPGEKFSYNQTNYLLLGRIIDKLSKQPFSRFITQRQFDIVGMPLTARSGFTDAYDVVTGSATLYTNENGGIEHNSQHSIPPFLRTGAGISSSAEELAHWIIALQQGKLFKSNQTLKQLWTPSTFNDGRLNSWALGWPVRNRAEHFAVGGYGGARAAFFVYPDDDIAVIVLTNLAGCNPETFIDEIAGFYIPDMRIANGFGLPPDIKALRKELLKRGFDQAIEIISEQKSKDPKNQPGENELNAWGYALIEQDQMKEALEIFKLNINLYPQSWNVYDSYGEALELSRQKEQAAKMFKRSLELNPQNKNAVEHLKRLEK